MVSFTLPRIAAAVVLAGCVAVSRAENNVPPSPSEAPSFLQELTEENFNAAVTAELPILVEFYAPWCGQCKTFKPEVERAAKIAVERNLGFTLGRIDAQKYMDVASDHDIKNVPTFVLFRDGVATKFPSLHTAEAMLAGADKLLGLEQHISPVKNFDGPSHELAMWLFWRGQSDRSFHTTLMLFEPPNLTGPAAAEAEELRAAFEGAAEDLLRFSNLRFASVSNVEAMADFELPTDRATVVVYKDHDEGRAIYTGPPVSMEIARFTLIHDVPLVTTNLWHRNLQQSRKRVTSLGLFFVTGKQFEDGPTLARVKASLKEVVLGLEAQGAVTRGDFTLAIVDGTKYKSWLQAYDQPMDRLPAIVMENTTSGQLFAGPDMVEAGTSNPSAEFLASLAAAAEEAAAAAKAEAEESGEEALEHKLPEGPSLTWVTVPVDQVTSFLSGYASGTQAPVKTLADKDRAGYKATPTPLAPVPTPEPSAASGHDSEEL